MATNQNLDIKHLAALFTRARAKSNEQSMIAATKAAASFARAQANAEEARLLAIFADAV